MTSAREKQLSKEELKFNKVRDFETTETSEIESLKELINCIKEVEDKSDVELEEIYQKGLEEIKNRYNTTL